MYPSLIKLTGYRNMLRLTLVAFAVGIVLIPWSSRITGPIDQPESAINISSGFGSGSGAESDLGFCGFSVSQESVNEDSIKRIPVCVWAILLLTIFLIFFSRYCSLSSQ